MSETPVELRARLKEHINRRWRNPVVEIPIDLAHAIDALLARLATAEEENDELHEDLVRVMQERNAAMESLDTVDSLARKMATAIGWGTEGDNWIEKAATKAAEIAAALRQADTDRARLATAEADLAVVNEIVGDYFDGAGGHDLMVELRSRLAAVARREQP